MSPLRPSSRGVRRLAWLTMPLVAAAWLGVASADGVDLKWMMAVEAGIPTDIRVNRIHEDHGEMVVAGSAPRYVEIASYLRKIEADGVGVPKLVRVTPSGKAQAFIIRIHRLPPAQRGSP
jgi:hypothetical protein